MAGRLNGTKVTDAGLAHLKGLSQLKNLQLENTKVTDAGLAHLKELNQLLVLVLDDTNATDVGLEYLKGLTQLQELDLMDTRSPTPGWSASKRGYTDPGKKATFRGTKVTDAGVKNLRRRGGS